MAKPFEEMIGFGPKGGPIHGIHEDPARKVAQKLLPLFLLSNAREPAKNVPSLQQNDMRDQQRAGLSSHPAHDQWPLRATDSLLRFEIDRASSQLV